MLCPKDGKAGGSWIGMQTNGNTAVLLNGGFVKHQPLPSYCRSRGLVFLDILSSDNMVTCFSTQNLGQVEPFTIILWNGITLNECRWDGDTKHVESLSPSQAHMWSSATLYDTETSEKRKCWFEDWLEKNPNPTAEDILHFHRHAGDGNIENDLLMNREDELLTLSITNMELTNDVGLMKYFDLDLELTTRKKISFQKAPVKQR
jgi:hypothetical protein